ncbi:MAG TPA: nitrite/sulfite reductase, partial [Geobacteraceae bacterium]
DAVGRRLAAVGLTGRGACGGAVRGVTCATPYLAAAPAAQRLARRLHHHFTHNPRFEGLPKKFKIGVDAGYDGARHLIQDLGLVLVGEVDASPCYDVWCAGGLGREPQPAFLFAEQVAEERIIPLAEAVITVYRSHTPAGKRLKHLVAESGEEEFRRLVAQALDPTFPAPIPDGVDRRLTPVPVAPHAPLQAGIFAGELTAGGLRRLAEIAARHAGGFLIVTADQNLVLLPASTEDAVAAATALIAAGFTGSTREERVPFRICPGSHDCRLGLAPTRDVARELLAAMGTTAEGRSWAIAGCPNSCSQPQLAEVGILTTKLVKESDGERRPRFDLYRRTDAGFGMLERQGLDLGELLQVVTAAG